MNGVNVHKSLYAVFAKQSCEQSSICHHLSRLLSARKECHAYLPDYGLRDVLFVFRHFPESLHGYLNDIQNTIEQYEPRLKNIKVSCANCLTAYGILQLTIKADFGMQSLNFNANVNCFERINVDFITP